MRSKDLIANAKKANAATLAAAFQTGDETKMTEALATFCGDIEEAVLQQAQQEADERNQDTAIMAARGVHVLTSAEMNYYTELGKCVKSGDPKMAITNFKVAMPETVIDGVIGTIKKEHPLLDRISFVNTSYLTRFVVNAARFRCDLGQHHRQDQQGTDRRAERLQHDPAEVVRVYVYQPGPC